MISFKDLFNQFCDISYEINKTNGLSNEESMRKAIRESKEKLSDFHKLIDEKDMKLWEISQWKKVTITIEKPHILKKETTENWYDPKMKLTKGFFWQRYKSYLNEKNWPSSAIEAIDKSTDQILSLLGNPESEVPFDKRGLVLGYVQSGKTANFTGLINKAFDMGYRLIIVLGGIHNDLRAQTQLRLEDEVVGMRKGQSTGVGKVRVNDSDHIINLLTSIEQDFSTKATNVRINIAEKGLAVIKKNKTVLENLKEYISEFISSVDPTVLQKLPVLIIDDEADQASVDTSRINKEEDPKTINRLIRELINLFHKKCYVGYTATPFANLLINVDTIHETANKDLYPSDFVVGLPKPEKYCGPEEFFNVYEDADYQKPSLIRYIGKEDEEAFEHIKKAQDAHKFELVPPKMAEGIYAFLIAIAIRNLRGQSNKHNSMLIHTSRFKNVQSTIKAEVESFFEEVKNQILYNSKGSHIKEVEKLYLNDTNKTILQWNEKEPLFNWEEVYKEIRESIEKIQVMEINGNSKDALDYYEYETEGMHVIAVGGDKLSRGITLEGLSVTYYFRNTLMYDTLMQMGRWFGYREGYMDLCRIYTTSDIASNFEHLAITMKELRDEFEQLNEANKTPRDFALKMLSHPSMTLTSSLKMQHAVKANLIYEGTLQQTRLFDTRIDFYKLNMRAVNRLLTRIQNNYTDKFQVDGKGEGTGYYMYRDIDVNEIVDFLQNYITYDAPKVNSRLLRGYIETAAKHGDLVNWTVAVVEGNESSYKHGLKKFPVEFDSLKIETAPARKNAKDIDHNDADRIDIKALVSGNNQEFVDLMNTKDSKLNGSRKDLREKRGKENGFLIIYPLHPEVPAFKQLNIEFSEKLVPIGIAISFPESDIGERSGIYVSNESVLKRIQQETQAE
ncbi:Z1 domain-containing protein [Bacillus sp. E(2018)]|uniref:Z1 domain-containing protein n=1 Tax=Bacillus sp. E(2018) TaxID=2502239 RepID=UPI0025707BBF|nr:Z1 domain-containing protein [Bacillus sp. E(2018)]